MLQISVWARKHIHASRAIIIFIKVLLAILAFLISDILVQEGIRLPAAVPLLAIIIFVISVLCYPPKRTTNKNFYSSFTFRKTCDFALGAATFVMLICLVRQTPVQGTFYPFNTAYAASGTLIKQHSNPAAEEILQSLKNGRDKNTLTRKEKKILKQEFKKQVKTWVVASVTGDKEEKGNAGLIILAIIGALGLLYLLAALVCSLSCNGADGAAIAVGIIGTAAIVWGLIALIRRIKRGPKKVDTKPEI